MSQEIAKLVVALEAQTSKFQKDMDGAIARMNKLQARTARMSQQTNQHLAAMRNQFASVGKAMATFGVGLSVGSIVSVLTSGVRAAIEYGDTIAKMAAKTGMAGEQISALAYAARQMDVEVNSLALGLKKMQVAISEANSGSKSMGETFRALGLDVREIVKLDPSSQFEAIAEQISKMKDPADRVRAAVDLFGRAGADLLPMFMDGAKGIRAAREEAERLGLVMSDEQLRKLGEADDAIKKISAAWDGVFRTVAVNVSPMLTGFLDGLTELLTRNIADVYSLQNAWLGLANTVTTAWRVIREKGISATWEDVRQAIVEQQKAMEAMAKGPAARGSNSAVPRGTVLPPGFAAISGDDDKKGSKGADPIKQATEALQDHVAKLREQVATFGGNEVAAAAYSVTMGELAEKFKVAGAAAEPMRAEIVALTAELYLAKQAAEAQAEAATIIESLKTEQQLANDAIARYNELRQMGLLTEAQTTAAIKKTNEALAESARKAAEAANKMTTEWDQATRNMQDAMSDAIFNSFDEGIEGMLDQWVNALKRMAAEVIAANIFGSIKSGLAGFAKGSADKGGFLGSLAGFVGSMFGGGIPKMAQGGLLAAGEAAFVGEQGMELIVPQAASRVIPNHKLGGQSVTMNFAISAPQGTVSRQTQQQIAAAAQRGIFAAGARNN